MTSLVLKILSLLVLLGFVSVCWSADHQGLLWSLSAANNDFGVRLFQALRQTNNENFLFSPLSLSIAFGMLYHGAGGHTARELSQVLGYQRAVLHNRDSLSYAWDLYMKIIRSPEYELNSANLIVVDRSLKLDDQYNHAMHRIYDSVVENADFRRDGTTIKNKINSWVNCKTKGMIPTLLDRVDPNDVMIILNAAYFKGIWDQPFDTNSTSPQHFYNFGTTPKTVQMMNQDDVYLDYFACSTFSALELPYKSNVSMLIFLPHSKTGLPALQDSLSAPFLTYTLSHLQPQNLNVHLPKFRAESSFSLQDPLQRLGMRNVFGPTADFSGISRSRGVMVSEVVHKVSVIVDEAGTVAAAATAIHMGRISMPPRAIEFVVDRPFIYAIIDRSRDFVLFMGRVCQI